MYSYNDSRDSNAQKESIKGGTKITMETLQQCKEILLAMGGEGNITCVAHCATRLRLTIHDVSKVKEEEVTKIDGVLGLVRNQNEMQVIIGPGVEATYMTFISLGDFQKGTHIQDDEAKKQDEVLQKQAKKNWLLTASDFIAGSVLPSLPVIVAGGMISAVLVVLTTFFGLSADTGTYKILNSVYSAAFGFLPIFIGYNAAQKLHVSPMLGALLGAVLVSPDINGVEGLDFFGISVTSVSYGSSILPVIFGVLFMSVIYRPLERYIPKEIKFFAVPLLTMLVCVPVTLICLGPIATWAGAIIGDALLWMNANLGWLSVGVMGAITAFLIFSGTGSGLYAAIFLAFAENGFENFVMPGMLAGNLAVGGAAIAAMTLLKNKETKAMALSSGLTAVFGITEPAIFGVLVRFKKPFIGAAIGGGIGGLFAGFMHVAEFAFVSPGVASAIAFINPDGTSTNIIMAVITMILAFGSAFIATRFIGFEE